jgi:hypothetical protein
MSINYTNFVHCKTLQNLPKLGFLVWKCAIWQLCYVVRTVKMNAANPRKRYLPESGGKYFFRASWPQRTVARVHLFIEKKLSNNDFKFWCSIHRKIVVEQWFEVLVFISYYLTFDISKNDCLATIWSFWYLFYAIYNFHICMLLYNWTESFIRNYAHDIFFSFLKLSNLPPHFFKKVIRSSYATYHPFRTDEVSLYIHTYIHSNAAFQTSDYINECLEILLRSETRPLCATAHVKELEKRKGQVAKGALKLLTCCYLSPVRLVQPK